MNWCNLSFWFLHFQAHWFAALVPSTGLWLRYSIGKNEQHTELQVCLSQTILLQLWWWLSRSSAVQVDLSVERTRFRSRFAFNMACRKMPELCCSHSKRWWQRLHGKRMFVVIFSIMLQFKGFKRDWNSFLGVLQVRVWILLELLC